MRKKFIILGAAIFALSACTKSVDNAADNIVNGSSNDRIVASPQFVTYTILKNQQYCDKSVYQPVEYEQLTFIVKFDSSAIYQTAAKDNQYDINKLFGFSDNNAVHHDYSARFGWRWSNNALRLFAYIYNDKIMSNKELGTVTIGTENSCSIEVTDSAYIFTLNNNAVTMPREGKTAKAEGYKLYPYFGGDETAPHAISIFIKEL